MILTIRKLTEADLDPLDPLLIAAYGEPGSFKPELRRYLALQPDGWRLALSDGAPVGMVGAVDYGSLAYVGMMAVDPAFQCRGIGMALMSRLLTWLDGRGCPLVLLDATEAGAKLYAKLGFVEDELALVFQQDDYAKSPCPSVHVNTLCSADLAALAAFDAPIFGADRLAVFAAFFAEIPERAFVVRDDAGNIAGYLFAQPSTLGPWAARTPEIAEALLAAALPLQPSGALQALVPGCNRAATSLLMRYGFSKKRVQRHMRRGGSIALSQRFMLYGQASFTIG